MASQSEMLGLSVPQGVLDVGPETQTHFKLLASLNISVSVGLCQTIICICATVSNVKIILIIEDGLEIGTKSAFWCFYSLTVFVTCSHISSI